MEIGLFQLENLTISRSPFLFLDLRLTKSENLPPSIANCLRDAQPVSPNEVELHLRNLPGSKERPILLIDEAGHTSASVARRLEEAGYNNIYVVAGGVEGLLSEL